MAGSGPDEIFDLEAIAALKESAAIELKEQGNEYVKKGKKHYGDAVDCYTRAINQKALSDADHSVLYSNRAHVNLLLGNYRRALEDTEEAIKLSPTNVKALYRAAKASQALNLLDRAKAYCEMGLEKSPDNEELKKLAKQIDLKISEHQKYQAEVTKAVRTAKDIVSALEDRQIKFGKHMYQELTGIKKPVLDGNNILHWPVLLLYAEVMSSDFIEDFCETDMFSVHLDMMFSEDSPPLPWDSESAYTRDSIELYFEACSGVCLSKKELLNYLLQGTAASHLEDSGGEKTQVAATCASASGDRPKWIRVNEKQTLHDILKHPDFVVPGIPVFFVVSKKSRFHKDFKSGKWALPRIA
ncbi:uncharacterized protein LOC127254365 [Andrographis paniculata]|uniref:uncharacterized protein LOC127254365 n=1 Tax=Andrographis paniculata TaxID=175694 RepID=UPI0021E8C93E|nr:uncharacterized protein LOC127254365 [Andrographis paniculata]